MRLRRSVVAASLVCALAALAGCAVDEEMAIDAGVEGPEAAGSAPSPAADAAPGVEAGTARVSVDGQRATIVGNGASRRDILEELAALADFDLMLGRTPDAEVTVQLENVAFAEAADVLLPGIAYRLDYETAEDGSHRLTHLRGGAGLESMQEVIEMSPEALVARRLAGAGPRYLARMRKRLESMDPEERRRRRERGQQLIEAARAKQAMLIEQLGSDDPRVRLEALEEVEIEDEGLVWATQLATSDPDPDVRRAAVGRLAREESYGAIRGMIDALDDESSEVVITALRGLERTDDISLRPEVEPLMNHPDPEVREFAKDVFEYME